MTSASLWIEITIAGFPYLLALFFTILSVLGIKDISSIAPNEDYLPYISAAAVAASYVLGMLAHRVTQIIFPRIMRFIERRLRLASLSNEKEIHSATEAATKMVKIWQCGSERLNKEIDFQLSLSSLFRSLILSMPLLGVSIAAWLNTSGVSDRGLSLIIATLVTLTCMVVYRRQRRQLNDLRRAAYLEMEQKERESRVHIGGN